MHAEVVKALAAPDLAATWAAQGADAGGESPEQFGRFIRSEVEKWGKVARDLKISAEQVVRWRLKPSAVAPTFASDFRCVTGYARSTACAVLR
jgi:hypothetical protein